MKKLHTALLFIGAIVMLVACGPVEHATAQPYDNPYPEESIPERECDRFFDYEESGFTTRCFDYDNNACYTLYEPDGDTEYYCGNVKIWEYEPDDLWDGWYFMGGATLATVSKPTAVSNKTKPTSTRPTSYRFVAPKLAKPVTKPATSTKVAKPVAKPVTSTKVAKPVTKSKPVKIQKKSHKSTKTAKKKK